MTKESFVSIAWRLVPYWVRPWRLTFQVSVKLTLQVSVKLQTNKLDCPVSGVWAGLLGMPREAHNSSVCAACMLSPSWLKRGLTLMVTQYLEPGQGPGCLACLLVKVSMQPACSQHCSSNQGRA